MTVPPQEIFTATEAAEYLGITSGHLLELLCNGSLKSSIFVEDLDDSLGVDGAAVASALAIGSTFFQQDTFICKARGEVKFSSPVSLELKNIMLRLEDLNAVRSEQFIKEMNPDPSPDQFIASTDYTSVVWHGNTFRFTIEQAKVVRTLHRAHKDGLLDMHQEAIAAEINYSGVFRMEKIFRSRKIIHPAFGTVIEKTVRARYRLAL